MFTFRCICSRRIVSAFLTFFLGITLSTSLAQTTYYVANNGNDNNTGRSISSPFQTLLKVNSLSLKPGDQVLFRRGDIFRGTLTIRQSGSATLPIVVDAYGSGDKPVLAGSVPVSNWTKLASNIYQASCPSCGNSVTGLYNNGVALPLGRYPNLDVSDPGKGTLTIRAHTDRYQIFSQTNLPSSIDWKGAEVVMRPTAWIIDRAVVDHQYGDALNLFNYSTYTPKDGSGFFFQNHPSTLDQQGEWYYDAANKLFQLYDTTGTLNSNTLTATVYSRAIEILNVSNISLRNLMLTQTLNISLFASNASKLTMTNLDIVNSGEDGVTITGSGSDLLMTDCRVLDANNNGIQIGTYQNVTLRGNSLRHVGSVVGRGKSGDGQYNGLQSAANQNVLLEQNRIDSIGYNGITFANNTTIRQNVISNYCITKVDGGGIYAWNGNRTSMSNILIQSNIIYVSPNVRGKYSTEDYSIGIFLDDCVEKVVIKDNTIFGNTQWGAFLHGNPNITFTDNTLFDNFACQLVVYHNGGVCPIRNDLITRNSCVAKLPSQLVAQYESNADDLRQYGLIDSNYYARPFNEEGAILGVYNVAYGRTFSLKEWQDFSKGLDLNSSGSPLTYNQYKNEGAGGITRFNSTFEADNDNWLLIYSRYNNGEVTQDNSNKLDGGTLRVGFTTPSGQSNSYAQAIKQVALTKGKTYVLRFDAVATVDATILIYLRQYGPPYKEYDRRYSVTLSPNRKSYELPFTVSDSDPNAVVLFQIDGEGPTFWLDNVRLQEDVPIWNNPDDFIKLFYNPTLKDSLVTLDGYFRDVKNQVYQKNVLLKPFTSIVLFKDALPQLPADLSVSLVSNKRVLGINELARIRLRVSNQSDQPAALARWTCRLPANILFVDSLGQPRTDNVLTGTVSQLAPLTDTTFTFLVQPISAGLFRLSAQITTATSPDPDSRPNSGTADGEDDASSIELRVDTPLAGAGVFESPNPNQRLLPTVAPSFDQSLTNPDQADLSLQMEVSNRAPAVGSLITCTLSIANVGGRAAQGVRIENLLPNGFDPVSSGNWTLNGRSLMTTVESIPAAATVRVSFQARVTLPGFWLNQAQISASAVSDPDSTPGNGFSNGEDDEAQTNGRTL